MGKIRLSQALDFFDESEALFMLVEPLPEDKLNEPTQFKDWTLSDVVQHLHIWNWAANESLVNERSFLKFLDALLKKVAVSGSLREFENDWLEGLSGPELLREWRRFYTAMTARFSDCDPKKRLKWAGPDMSARSSITARLMETWAHGQEAYDHLGVIRQDEDRIHNIAILGTNTYKWTFLVRQEQIPGPMPFVRLKSPSGIFWEFGQDNDQDTITGSATEFCQVVTQVRNVADTNLKVVGSVANEWMSKAQCFAGSAEKPPPAGTRFTRSI